MTYYWSAECGRSGSIEVEGSLTFEDLMRCAQAYHASSCECLRIVDTLSTTPHISLRVFPCPPHIKLARKLKDFPVQYGCPQCALVWEDAAILFYVGGYSMNNSPILV